MPRFPVHTVGSAPAAARPALRMLHELHSHTTTFAGRLAHSPALLTMLVVMEETLNPLSTIDTKTRVAISLAVSGVNDCPTSQSAGTVDAQAAGWSSAEIAGFIAGASGGEPKLRALLSVAREIAANAGAVREESWQSALDAGWTDTELAELFAHVCLSMFNDYFHRYAQTESEAPAPLGDEARKTSSLDRETGWMRVRRRSAPGWTGR